MIAHITSYAHQVDRARVIRFPNAGAGRNVMASDRRVIRNLVWRISDGRRPARVGEGARDISADILVQPFRGLRYFLSNLLWRPVLKAKRTWQPEGRFPIGIGPAGVPNGMISYFMALFESPAPIVLPFPDSPVSNCQIESAVNSTIVQIGDRPIEAVREAIVIGQAYSGDRIAGPVGWTSRFM